MGRGNRRPTSDHGQGYRWLINDMQFLRACDENNIVNFEWLNGHKNFPFRLPSWWKGLMLVDSSICFTYPSTLGFSNSMLSKSCNIFTNNCSYEWPSSDSNSPRSAWKNVKSNPISWTDDRIFLLIPPAGESIREATFPRKNSMQLETLSEFKR